MIRLVRLTAALAGVAALAGPAFAGYFDSINPNATPPFVFYGGPTDIGWYYTPSQSYSLTGIFTDFEPVPNGTGSRTITSQIQSERPVNGGTVLDQGTFTADSATGGLLGVTFNSPVTLHAGTKYFVDFLNTVGMGVNLGQWANNSMGNPVPSNGATTNLGAWYGNTNGDTMFTTAVIDPSYYSTATGNVSFAEPILLFSGNPINPTAVPEPSTIALLGAGGLCLAIARRRRRARG
jgi:hypothetical protein